MRNPVLRKQNVIRRSVNSIAVLAKRTQSAGRWPRLAHAGIVACVGITLPLHAQAPQELVQGPRGMTPIAYYELSLEAGRLYQQRDWAAAEEAYERLTAAYPWDSGSWFWLGYTRYQGADYGGAAQAFERAHALGVPAYARSLPAYAARAYARSGQSDKALEWLERALEEYRYELPVRLLQDSAFAGLRNNARFQALAPPQIGSTASRVAGWTQDLDYLLAQVRRLNPAYSGRALPDHLVDASERLREKIPALTDPQIAIEMQRLLAMLGQSHNDLLFPFVPGMSGRLAFTNLPLTLYQFPEGLYVIDAKPPYADLIGTRVLRFGSTDVADATRAVEGLVARDSDSQLPWFAPTFLRIPEVLQALGVTEEAARVPLTVADRAGQIRVVQLKPVALERRPKLFASRTSHAPQSPLYLRNVSEAHWFEALPQHGAVYVQLNQVANEREETLAQFSLRLREYVGENPGVQNLIVDVRHNNGGNTYLYTELLRTLIAFDTREETRLFMIIGRNTFSAAQNFAVEVDRLTGAIFVGELTGGKPEAFGDPPSFVLPYSGLEGETAAAVWNLSSPRDRRPWITPDIPVALTAEDYFANRDPVLETILGLLKEK